jgi:transcriptional regulator with XRE-family HTH domain
MPRRTTASPFTRKVGLRIRELRVDLDMSLAELASRAALSKGHLSSVEHGLAAITVETLERIADGLEIPPLYLLVFPAEDERARAAELMRALPASDIVKLRRELQVRVGLKKR